MSNIESTLSLDSKTLWDSDDVQRYFKFSETTLFRRLRDAKEGKIIFPLPISYGDGRKKGLRWDARTVESFIRASVPQQALPPPADESTTEEYKGAIKELEAMDIKLSGKKARK